MTEAPEGVWIEMDGDDILIHNNEPNLLELISTGLLLEYIRKDVSDALVAAAREEALREAAETAKGIADQYVGYMGRIEKAILALSTKDAE